MEKFFDSVKLIESLDPREAFFSERPNAVKLHKVSRKDEYNNSLERINYTNICSLYLCKYVN